MCPAARLVAAFVLLAMSSIFAQTKPEPEYQGKKGSVWVETLLNDASARQRALAAIALGKLWSEHRYEPALPTLGRAIRVDTSAAVRVQALTVIAGMDPLDVRKKIGDDKRSLADDLVQALESEKEPRVRRELAVTVGLFPDIAGRGVDPLIGYLKDTDPATRAAAATALGRVGAPAKDAVADLLPLLKDTDIAVRRSAAFALGRVSVEDSAAASALARLLPTEKEKDVRREIIVSLGLLADRSGLVVQAVAATLADPDPDIRRVAVRALTRFGTAASPAADAILKIAQSDPDKQARVDGVRAFAASLGPALKGRVKDLYPILEKDPDFEVRLAVVEELGALGNALKDDAETMAMLRKRLSDPQAKVRSAAASAIKRIEQPPPPDKKP